MGTSTTGYFNLWWEKMHIVVFSGTVGMNINWKRAQGFWCDGKGLYFNRDLSCTGRSICRSQQFMHFVLCKIFIKIKRTKNSVIWVDFLCLPLLTDLIVPNVLLQ